MIGKTTKQIFKAINDYNNANETIGANRNGINNLEILIYINDYRFYRGTNYKDFIVLLKEHYIEPFVNEVENIMWTGNGCVTIEVNGFKSKIEIYFID